MRKCKSALARAAIYQAAAIAATSLFHPTVDAGPLVRMTLLGENVTRGDSAFSSSVYVGVGDTVAYEVIAQVAPVGTPNSKGTITSLVAGTDGLNGLAFDLFQLSSADIQTNFTSTSTLNSAATWDGFGSSAGTLTARSSTTNQDLIGITAVQPIASWVGVLSPSLVTSGNFQIASATSSAFSSSLAMKWKTGGTGGVKINERAAPFTINNVSELGSGSSDPVVGFSNLTLLYNPASPPHVNGNWAASGSGDWENASNWGGSVPGGPDSSVSFAGVISAPATISVNAAETVGTLTLQSAQPITFAGSGTLSFVTVTSPFPTINDVQGSHEIATNIVLPSPSFAVVNVNQASDTLTLSGAISTGSSSSTPFLQKTGAGTLLLTHANNADLGVRVTEGTLAAGAINAMGKSLFIDYGGTFNLNGFNQVMGTGSASGPTPSLNLNSGASVYVDGVANTDVNIFAGGAAGGRGGVINGTVTIAAGGQFSGGDTLSSSTGIVQSTNGVLGPAGKLLFQIANASAAPGTSLDEWVVTNSLIVTADSSLGNEFVIDVDTVSGGTWAPATNFDSSLTYQWILIHSPGSVSGFDPADFVLDTANFVNPRPPNSTFSISQVGNDIVLNYSPTPEPSALSLLALGAMGLLKRRKKNRRAPFVI